ncbi:MAG: quinol monooxygenase YgiN [Hyphomicrobiaceae bacterium]|jgi:quinol monooxygenase YgiN
MVVILASVDIREEALEEALSISMQHVQRSRQEPGCISHQVSVDAENATRLVFVERWASREALDVHFEVPASVAFAKCLTALAVGKPVMDLIEAVG